MTFTSFNYVICISLDSDDVLYVESYPGQSPLSPPPLAMNAFPSAHNYDGLAPPVYSQPLYQPVAFHPTYSNEPSAPPSQW